MFFDWWRKLVRVGSKVSRRERRKPPHLRRASFKPWVEMLEDRTLLSPGNVSITPNPSLLNEGSTTTLTGSFTDPNLGQAHTLTLGWGDGVVETVLLPATSTLAAGSTVTGSDGSVLTVTAVDPGTGTITFNYPHIYLDNPGAHPSASGTYTISLTVTDSQGASQSTNQWVAQGPAPITHAPGAMPASYIGAIEAIAADPSNPDRVFVGSASGGIWRTTNATAPSPTWTPLTDQMPTLVIGSIALSPLDPNVVFAGTGTAGQGHANGSGGMGVLRSTDAGNTWTLLGRSALAGANISSIVPTVLNGGQVILAGTSNGLYRSADGGASWAPLSGQAGSGLPSGAVSDIVRDTGDGTGMRFYAALPGHGIYRSTDGGLSWSSVNNSISATIDISKSDSIRMSIQVIGSSDVVYAAISIHPTTYVFRSDDLGAYWASMGIETQDWINDIVHTTPEHNTILADRTNLGMVYVAGYYDANTTRFTPGPGGSISQGTWRHMMTVDDPHADARDLKFDANGNILRADDGGVYRLSNPSAALPPVGQIAQGPGAPNWVPVNGNLQTTQFYSVAYDDVNHTVFGGSQDNGSPEQSVQGNWQDVTGGDGFQAAVDNTSTPGYSIHYSTAQGLSNFQRRTFDNKGNMVSASYAYNGTVYPGGAYVGLDVSGAAWNFSSQSGSNGAGIAGNGSALTAGNPNAPHGSQAAFLEGTGSFSQQVLFATAANATISFFAAQRGNGNASWETFHVLVDGSPVASYGSTASPVPTSASYTLLTTPVFSVPAGYHTISFVGTNLNGGDNTVFIDDVVVNTSPTSPGATVAPVTVENFGFETPALPASFQYSPTAIGTHLGNLASDSLVPYVLNAVDPKRMLIDGGYHLYESFDQGDDLNDLGYVGDYVTAMAYGGRLGEAANPDVLYFGTINPTVYSGALHFNLYVRTAANGPFSRITSYPGRTVEQIALDPGNWQRGYVTDSQNQVWQMTSTDGGASYSFTNITNNLASFTSYITSIALYDPTPTSVDSDEAVYVGGAGGVFETLNPGPQATWFLKGANLPKVLVNDLHYDTVDHLLIAGTWGRGAWTLAGDQGAAPPTATATVQVNNVAPRLGNVPDQSADPGVSQTFNLGSFTDPGADTNWMVSVTWGDGSPTDSFTALAPGALSRSHTYAANGVYTVALTINDGDYGLDVTQFHVYVGTINTPPSNVSISPNPTTLNEGDTLTLAGSFTDPDTGQAHSVAINWGDSSPTTTVNLAAGVTTFSGVPHTYLDNPAGQPNGSFTIKATVSDDQGGVSPVPGTVQVTVHNVPPQFVPSTVPLPDQYAVPGVAEVIQLAPFTDPGVLDNPWTVQVNWGDQTTPDLLSVAALPGSLSYTHTYAAVGTYTATETLTDKDGGSTSTTFRVVVEPPIVTNTLDNGPGSLRAAVSAADQAVPALPAPITFAIPTTDPGYNQTTGQFTITLTSGELLLSHDMTILGPAADELAVSGNHTSRVFEINTPDLTGVVQTLGVPQNANVTAAISGLTIENGYAAAATNYGGGILNNGTLTLTDCTVTGNSSFQTTYGGSPGIENFNRLTVSNCTFSNNTGANGGGLINYYGTATVVNSTFYKNYASNAGGAIFEYGTATNSDPLTLTNCTLSDNSTGGVGGGLFNYFGTPIVANTIIAGNKAPTDPDFGGSVLVSKGYNLVGIGNSRGLRGFGNTGDQVGTAASPIDPGLAALGYYGGPTQTLALLAGRTAIDRGSNAYVTAGENDQRGFARVYNGTVDIGAFEVQPVTLTVTNTRDSGPGSLRQAIIVADNLGSVQGGTQIITFAIPANDPHHYYYKDDGSAGQVTLADRAPAVDQFGNPVTNDAQLLDPTVMGRGNTADPDYPHSWWSIQPASLLPAITSSVILDASSQGGNGYQGSPLIELDGSLLPRTGAGFTTYGLKIAANNNTVRGLVLNHFVDAFPSVGIWSTGDNNVIQGNFVGTDPSGTTVFLTDPIAAGPSSRNMGYGVLIDGGSGNLVGTDGDGTADASERNVISGTDFGVMLSSLHAPQSQNTVAGNFIGTDAGGTRALGNYTGVGLVGGSNDVIGTTGSGASDADRRNVISGNYYGVLLGAQTTVTYPISSVQVTGNFIGTDVTGKQRLGNASYGVAINGADSTQLGRPCGLANVIAYNGVAGVAVLGNNGHLAIGNAIEGNSIHDNAGAPGGILLGSGANNNQPAPVLAYLLTSAAGTTVTGTLAGQPNTQVHLEFFANAAPDPSGFGQGQTFLGAADLTTGPDGSFTARLGSPVPAGQGWLSATATVAANGTSAFSRAVAVTLTALTASPASPVYGTDSVTLTATLTSPAAGAPAPTGTVDFYDTTTGQDLGSVSLVNGTAALSTRTLAAGGHAITANYGGDATFLASSAGASLTVARATPGLRVADAGGTYNGTAFPATAAVAGVVSGVDSTPSASLEGVGLTLDYQLLDAGGNPVQDLGGQAPVNAGSYRVTASFAGSADYAPASAGTTFTITPAPLTVTADDQTITYGSPLPAFTAHYAGFVNNEGPGVLSGTLTFGGSATTAVHAGSYAITPGGLTAQNYTLTFKSATLTINQATPTVVVTPVSATYDGQPHGTTTEVFGVGGVDLGPAAVSYTGGSAPVNAGTYTATGSFAGSQDYTPATGTASIVIAKATAVFSLVSPPVVTDGAATATLSGSLLAGSLAPPGQVTLTINGVSQTGTINPDGTFSVAFPTSALGTGAYQIQYDFAGDSNFEGVTAVASLDVTYGILVLSQKSTSKGGGAIPIQIELTNAAGQDVSSATTTVTAVQIAPAPGQTGSTVNLDAAFTFNPQQGKSPASYTYSVKPKTLGLGAGTYLLYFTVSGDPLEHSVQFTIQ